MLICPVIARNISHCIPLSCDDSLLGSLVRSVKDLASPFVVAGVGGLGVLMVIDAQVDRLNLCSAMNN